MINYPKLDQRTFDYLPEPFKESIRHDERKPVNPWINNDKVVTIDQLKAYQKERNEWIDMRHRINQGCEMVINEMKKGN